MADMPIKWHEERLEICELNHRRMVSDLEQAKIKEALYRWYFEKYKLQIQRAKSIALDCFDHETFIFPSLSESEVAPASTGD